MIMEGIQSPTTMTAMDLFSVDLTLIPTVSNYLSLSFKLFGTAVSFLSRKLVGTSLTYLIILWQFQTGERQSKPQCEPISQPTVGHLQ